MTINGTAIIPDSDYEAVLIHVLFDRPLYDLLAKYAKQHGHYEDTIIREAVRAYLGDDR